MKQLDKARKAIGKAQEAHGRWQTTRDVKSAELADLEGRAGGEIIAAGEGGDAVAARLGGEVTGLRMHVEAARKAADEAARQVDAARRSCLREAAGVLREAAQRARADADRHWSRTAELLAQVAKHEGVKAWAEVPAGQPVSGSNGLGLSADPARAQTRTRALRAEAERADREAGKVEQLAEATEIGDVKFDKAMATADPDGPEAKRVADRKAATEREQAESKARAERELAQRQAMAGAFDRALIQGGQARDAAQAANVRQRLVSSRSTRAGYAEALAGTLSAGKPAAEPEARKQAERLMADAVRSAGKSKAPVG